VKSRRCRLHALDLERVLLPPINLVFDDLNDDFVYPRWQGWNAQRSPSTPVRFTDQTTPFGNMGPEQDIGGRLIPSQGTNTERNGSLGPDLGIGIQAQ